MVFDLWTPHSPSHVERKKCWRQCFIVHWWYGLILIPLGMERNLILGQNWPASAINLQGEGSEKQIWDLLSLPAEKAGPTYHLRGQLVPVQLSWKKTPMTWVLPWWASPAHGKGCRFLQHRSARVQELQTLQSFKFPLPVQPGHYGTGEMGEQLLAGPISFFQCSEVTVVGFKQRLSPHFMLHRESEFLGTGWTHEACASDLPVLCNDQSSQWILNKTLTDANKLHLLQFSATQPIIITTSLPWQNKREREQSKILTYAQ